MQIIAKPNVSNCFLNEHAELLISSYRYWTGKDLVNQALADKERYSALYNAPYAIVSHNTKDNPIFNYGNKTALRIFEMDWAEFTALASKMSAEPINQIDRDKLLARVSKYGFIDDYKGIRISSTGKRFMIESATVWNIVDEEKNYYGQAAVFYNWSEAIKQPSYTFSKKIF